MSFVRAERPLPLSPCGNLLERQQKPVYVGSAVQTEGLLSVGIASFSPAVLVLTEHWLGRIDDGFRFIGLRGLLANILSKLGCVEIWSIRGHSPGTHLELVSKLCACPICTKASELSPPSPKENTRPNIGLTRVDRPRIGSPGCGRSRDGGTTTPYAQG